MILADFRLYFKLLFKCQLGSLSEYYFYENRYYEFSQKNYYEQFLIQNLFNLLFNLFKIISVWG